MIYLCWLILILLSWCVDALGLIMVPLALLGCRAKSEHLPVWAWPWDNDRDGINGDAGWRSATHANGNQARFGWRFVWLAIRNPGNNFGYLLGIAQTAKLTYDFRGDRDTSDQGHPGHLSVDAFRDGRHVAFGHYYVYRYPCWPSRCLRVRIGWKLNDMLHDGSIAEIVCVVNPVMTFAPAPTAAPASES
jgi:hypothetical protein